MRPTTAPSVVPPRHPRWVWWWFLIPVLSFGLGTSVMVLIGGAYLRSRRQKLAAAGYFLLTVLFVVGVQFTETGTVGAVDAVIWPALLITWLGGTAHVAVLQGQVRQRGARNAGPPATVDDPAFAAAQWRVRRRQEARALLATDPALAAELRIGRPDLPARQYDDGGLVDLNQVPGEVLTAELDLPATLAADIVSQRDRRGGFGSAEELVVYCADMSPERLSVIRDRLVFGPH